MYGYFTLFPGNFKLKEEEQYNGDVYAEGNVHLAENAQITGNIYPYAGWPPGSIYILSWQIK